MKETYGLRGRVVQRAVIIATMIGSSWFNSHSRHVPVVAFLDKTPYDADLCLVELKQTANNLYKISRKTRKLDNRKTRKLDNTS